MEKKLLYRLEIAPVTSISPARSPFFSYLSDQPLQAGTPVRIPFGKRNLQGIVFSNTVLLGKAPHWMKWAARDERTFPLTAKQLALSLFLAESSFTSLGISLRHFLVKKVRARPRQAESRHVVTPAPLVPLPTMGRDESTLLSKIDSEPKKPLLYHFNHEEKARTILLSMLQRAIRENYQILFLVPELFLVQWWVEELKAYFSFDNVAVFHSGLKGSELSRTWERITQGDAQIILGTRHALFAPFSRLRTILLTDEDDETSYKQWEMSPRYSTQNMVHELSRLYKANVLLTSPTPSLRSVLSLENKRLILLHDGVSKTQKAEMEIINMRFEKRKNRQEIFSSVLLASMKVTLKNRGRILLVVRQKGYSTISLCRECRTVLRCLQCEKPMRERGRGDYRCMHCGFEGTSFPSCKQCGSQYFFSFGAGTEKIETEVKKVFFNARVLRYDKTTRGKKIDFEKTMKAIKDGEYDILISTHALSKVPNLPKTSQIAIIEADSFLAFPDYQAEEKIARSYERFRRIAGSLGKVQIQTFEPELPVFSEWLDKEFIDIAKDIIRERQVLAYPPVTRIFKIECLGRTAEASLQSARSLISGLAKYIDEQKLPINLTAPHLPISGPKNKRYQFFLKFPQSVAFPKKLRTFLLQYSSVIYIDPNPISLN